MIPVVGQRRVNVGERDRGILLYDLSRGHAELLMPERYVLHADAAPGDARLGSPRPLNDFNMLATHISHRLALVRTIFVYGVRDYDTALAAARRGNSRRALSRSTAARPGGVKPS